MKAIALVEARDHVCCRYRVRAFESALAASGWSLTIEPLEPGLVGRMRQFAGTSRYDATLLQRKLLPGWQLRELRRRSRRLIFDYDDAVLYRDSYDRRGPHDRRRSERFKRTVRLADTVIAGNSFLADRAHQAGAPIDRVRVIPTCIAPQPAAAEPKASSGPGLELVWIGSSSTMAGLELQRPLWERIGREVPGTRLRMICDRFLRFDALPVIDVPWSQAAEARELAASDVGISWVPDDLWSRGKCGLKILQYQAAGLPVLANPVGVHSEMIHPGVDGYLVEDADAWVEAVRKLAAEPELRRWMGQSARSLVQANYSVAAWADSFVDCLAGDGGSSPTPDHPVAIPRPKSLPRRETRIGGGELPSNSRQALA
ncbi:glycosyltransferase family 4 protein [Tundrisphaera sp. TA3]|uniref:glycosyltransferase family 4 protein n=1 Tax=Tundrisphaera sp. TA3 TaxID=3435775 RepID=UPI003EB82499